MCSMCILYLLLLIGFPPSLPLPQPQPLMSPLYQYYMDMMHYSYCIHSSIHPSVHHQYHLSPSPIYLLSIILSMAILLLLVHLCGSSSHHGCMGARYPIPMCSTAAASIYLRRTLMRIIMTICARPSVLHRSSCIHPYHHHHHCIAITNSNHLSIGMFDCSTHALYQSLALVPVPLQLL
jgi:hypothetical protein